MSTESSDTYKLTEVMIIYTVLMGGNNGADVASKNKSVPFQKQLGAAVSGVRSVVAEQTVSVVCTEGSC